MKRKLLLIVLASGSVIGFASGFAWCGHHSKNSHWRQQLADHCVQAALKAGHQPAKQ
jgi:hypothetical protein